VNKNWATSKFGQYKTDLGMHTFHIDGNLVELYFSPSDHTDSHIQSTIASAEKDLYFGEYTFTEHTDADMIVAKFHAGLNVYGIDDSYSNSYYPKGQFTTNLTSSNFKVYNESSDSIYHNKFLIVDPSDTCSDPRVLTGSHNWSTSADTKNDENTVIIHNDTVANLFLQYFKASFNNLSGSKMTAAAYDCHPAVAPTNVPSSALFSDKAFVYPNPSSGAIVIAYQLSSAQNVRVDICNITGQFVASIINNEFLDAGSHTSSIVLSTPGIYFVRIMTGSEVFTKKIVIAE